MDGEEWVGEEDCLALGWKTLWRMSCVGKREGMLTVATEYSKHNTWPRYKATEV